jgi:hypothetical protein
VCTREKLILLSVNNNFCKGSMQKMAYFLHVEHFFICLALFPQARLARPCSAYAACYSLCLCLHLCSYAVIQKNYRSKFQIRSQCQGSAAAMAALEKKWKFRSLNLINEKLSEIAAILNDSAPWIIYYVSGKASQLCKTCMQI